MTVRELVRKLQELPQEALVVMSSDGEGNSYSPLDSLWIGDYVAESTWSGNMFVEDELEPGEGVAAVCLDPTN